MGIGRETVSQLQSRKEEPCYINLTCDNLDQEHICCAISDKKHQEGVILKKTWLKEQLQQGHVFRKLDEKGKVFIEYGPLETALVPVQGMQYLYIYCCWVSGKFKGKGHGKALLEYAIQDAKSQGKAGICVLTGKKKTPFLSDKQFVQRYGFELADTLGSYELQALRFDTAVPMPSFTEQARKGTIAEEGLVIYYNTVCPYIENCLREIQDVCREYNLQLTLHSVQTPEEARKLPCVMNHFAVFFQGRFVTHELLNRGRLLKFLGIE